MPFSPKVLPFIWQNLGWPPASPITTGLLKMYQCLSYSLWFFCEKERYRTEQLAMEQWRQESREHEKQMFSIFCGVLSQCNAALNILLKARLDQSDDNTLRPSAASVSTNSSSSKNNFSQRHHTSSPHTSGGEDKSPNSSSGQEQSS